nr:uncharacterized protein LOC127488319 [Oryctolagus cuniculus]
MCHDIPGKTVQAGDRDAFLLGGGGGGAFVPAAGEQLELEPSVQELSGVLCQHIWPEPSAKPAEKRISRLHCGSWGGGLLPPRAQLPSGSLHTAPARCPSPRRPQAQGVGPCGALGKGVCHLFLLPGLPEQAPSDDITSEQWCCNRSAVRKLLPLQQGKTGGTPTPISSTQGRRGVGSTWMGEMGPRDSPLQTVPGGGSKCSALGNCRQHPLHLGGFPVQAARPAHMKGAPVPRYVRVFAQLCHLHWPYVNGMYPRAGLLLEEGYPSVLLGSIQADRVFKGHASLNVHSSSSSIKRFSGTHSALGLNFLLISKLEQTASSSVVFSTRLVLQM